MTTRAPFRVLLAALLATGVGLAAELAPAGASARDDRAATASAKKKKKPVVKLAETDLGRILVSRNGRTLYALDPDGTDTSVSNCTASCADLWPPLKAKKAVAGKGLDKSLLTIGVEGQVAYNDHLLYAYASDSAPGDTNGQGVGGVWHVLDADGEPIE
jgi:predicted lipoprotein with Yx(FWY)xxD motif